MIPPSAADRAVHYLADLTDERQRKNALIARQADLLQTALEAIRTNHVGTAERLVTQARRELLQHHAASRSESNPRTWRTGGSHPEWMKPRIDDAWNEDRDVAP